MSGTLLNVREQSWSRCWNSLQSPGGEYSFTSHIDHGSLRTFRSVPYIPSYGICFSDFDDVNNVTMQFPKNCPALMRRCCCGPLDEDILCDSFKENEHSKLSSRSNESNEDLDDADIRKMRTVGIVHDSQIIAHGMFQ